jgi:hypothetical protein
MASSNVSHRNTSSKKAPVKRTDAASGPGCTAVARGKDAVAVAAGAFAHAKLLCGDHAEAVAAAGCSCLAKNYDSRADMAAVGTGARSISHHRSWPRRCGGLGGDRRA